MAFTADMILGEFEDAARLGGARQVEAAEFWMAARERARRYIAMWRELPENRLKGRAYMREYTTRPAVVNRRLVLDPTPREQNTGRAKRHGKGSGKGTHMRDLRHGVSCWCAPCKRAWLPFLLKHRVRPIGQTS